MASLAARHAAHHLRAARPVCRRTLHLTPVVQKKRGKVEIEDLFSDEVEGDLIKPEPAPQAKSSGVTKASSTRQASPSSSTSAAAPAAKVSKRRRLSEKSRAARFDNLCAFVEPRLGRRPTLKMPMVRKSAWAQLLQLAASEAQMVKITEMFPGWKESGHEFDAAFSEAFVRRCEELSCPLLALQVFGDYAKYNLPLSLAAARHLLHSLHAKHPLEATVTAAALYPVYGLPPVERDAVSCALVMAACFRDGSTKALKAAEGMLPQLEKTLRETKPQRRTHGNAEGNETVAVKEERPTVWMKWALKKVDKALFVQRGGERVDWLALWRERSGHIPVPGKF
ncbi:hypothetical protein LshimejAT787_0600870 [Lyophyllum shimeji]|uniref:Uncharacterized protein n=1 Tax=Lyophyllum shimeji TaxID=47721 RepID=A0A9P3PM83_LYOSH|nr:hypothetical protein LshimejAT787_0600870 [Lyophyllum shimeji]